MGRKWGGVVNNTTSTAALDDLLVSVETEELPFGGHVDFAAHVFDFFQAVKAKLQTVVEHVAHRRQLDLLVGPQRLRGRAPFPGRRNRSGPIFNVSLPAACARFTKPVAAPTVAAPAAAVVAFKNSRRLAAGGLVFCCGVIGVSLLWRYSLCGKLYDGSLKSSRVDWRITVGRLLASGFDGLRGASY